MRNSFLILLFLVGAVNILGHKTESVKEEIADYKAIEKLAEKIVAIEKEVDGPIEVEGDYEYGYDDEYYDDE